MRGSLQHTTVGIYVSWQTTTCTFSRRSSRSSLHSALAVRGLNENKIIFYLFIDLGKRIQGYQWYNIDGQYTVQLGYTV